MSENWPLAIKGYFSQFYDCICLISTLLLVGYSIFVYAKNYDISRVNYKEFHSTMKDIYPSISLCFGDTLDPEILKARNVAAIMLDDIYLSKQSCPFSIIYSLHKYVQAFWAFSMLLTVSSSLK